jgi:hypothetical protein
MLLKDAACSALSAGLTYVVTPLVMPVENSLCWVEQTAGALIEDSAEGDQQDTVRILKGPCKLKDSLTGVDWRSLSAMETSEELNSTSC